ncbi:hypothetical protein HMPREF1250_1276 [Megasphaera vaginalis (ex Srinivasan et al. 2021)]|uniref:Uncharacterized protein n=1 Tax=Megasphaera vaginalis (ex Srinivasan et al. 2021) TaxID=1111454 RepID=U7UVB4_9FIRM|nr:hypothetical protein HMPREF1250_1276 [Megasphaera vaginalis (ex Srinivasan et al. 2021)]
MMTSFFYYLIALNNHKPCLPIYNLKESRFDKYMMKYKS